MRTVNTRQLVKLFFMEMDWQKYHESKTVNYSYHSITPRKNLKYSFENLVIIVYLFLIM